MTNKNTLLRKKIKKNKLPQLCYKIGHRNYETMKFMYNVHLTIKILLSDVYAKKFLLF